MNGQNDRVFQMLDGCWSAGNALLCARNVSQAKRKGHKNIMLIKLLIKENSMKNKQYWVIKKIVPIGLNN